PLDRRDRRVPARARARTGRRRCARLPGHGARRRARPARRAAARARGGAFGSRATGVPLLPGAVARGAGRSGRREDRAREGAGDPRTLTPENVLTIARAKPTRASAPLDGPETHP